MKSALPLNWGIFSHVFLCHRLKTVSIKFNIHHGTIYCSKSDKQTVTTKRWEVATHFKPCHPKPKMLMIVVAGQNKITLVKMEASFK